MASWNDLANQVTEVASGHDIVRRRCLRRLAKLTGRNAIVYYSGWLQKIGFPQSGQVFSIHDNDKNGFMAAVHKMDRTKGLDLLLHTPGGEVAATESIIDYLRSMFDTNIRVIVPQIAMSGGTLIACAAREIVMGKHSNLGPIDPQFSGLAAHGIVEEWQRAYREIKADPLKAAVWQPILNKYPPNFIGECEKAVAWAHEIAVEALSTGMFVNDPDPKGLAEKAALELGDHALTKSHSRHISHRRAAAIGLKIVQLESDPALQDAVLSVHHMCVHTLAETASVKIIENDRGVAYITSVGQTRPA